MEYTGIISDPSVKRIELELSQGTPNTSEPPYEACLCQGLPKGDKMSSVIQKAVELGASEIRPISCARSVVKISARDTSEKTQRWQKVSLEAARQSGRGIVPRVMNPLSFAEAVDEVCCGKGLLLIPWEEERSVSLYEVLEPFAKCQNYPRISIFIGPEGGFDPKEVEYAISKGAVTVSLGRRILRTETAGPAVLAMLLYRLELP
jgi:16S rRNA (uracil1498-N3)-methyltransferase